MSLSSQSIDEIILVASQRNTSPRGVADDGNFFDSSSSNDQNSAKNNVSQADINKYASDFNEGIMGIALHISQYRDARDIVPSDVGEALDTFARHNADKSTQWTTDADMDEDDNDVVMDVNIKEQDVEKVRSGVIQVQALFRGKQVRDDTLHYDSDECSDEERANQMNLQNTSSPIFYSVYPQVESISLTDKEFKETFLSIFNGDDSDNIAPKISIRGSPSAIAIGDGINSADDGLGGGEMVVIGMMKRATYAFLVSKLS